MALDPAMCAALRVDLNDFVQEISPTKGVLAVRMEHFEGVASGDALQLILRGEPHWQALGADLLQWAPGDQDALVFDWERAQLGLYRVGPQVALWVSCDSPVTERKVRATWRRRRGPWEERLDRRVSPPQLPVASAPTPTWREGVSEKVAALLDETAQVYVQLRSQDSRADAQQAQAEFDALVEEWTNYCEPSVVSFPMLLDSLRQCMAMDGKARASFFDHMQSLMTSFLM